MKQNSGKNKIQKMNILQAIEPGLFEKPKGVGSNSRSLVELGVITEGHLLSSFGSSFEQMSYKMHLGNKWENVTVN